MISAGSEVNFPPDVSADFNVYYAQNILPISQKLEALRKKILWGFLLVVIIIPLGLYFGSKAYRANLYYNNSLLLALSEFIPILIVPLALVYWGLATQIFENIIQRSIYPALFNFFNATYKYNTHYDAESLYKFNVLSRIKKPNIYPEQKNNYCTYQITGEHNKVAYSCYSLNYNLDIPPYLFNGLVFLFTFPTVFRARLILKRNFISMGAAEKFAFLKRNTLSILILSFILTLISFYLLTLIFNAFPAHVAIEQDMNNLKAFAGWVCFFIIFIKSYQYIKDTLVGNYNPTPVTDSKLTVNKEKFEAVDLESITFENTYRAFANDQIQSRLLLTPTFMERLLELETAFNNRDLYLSFMDNQLLIMVQTKNSLVSKYNNKYINTRLFYRCNVQDEALQAYRKIKLIFSLIDILQA